MVPSATPKQASSTKSTTQNASTVNTDMSIDSPILVANTMEKLEYDMASQKDLGLPIWNDEKSNFEVSRSMKPEAQKDKVKTLQDSPSTSSNRTISSSSTESSEAFEHADETGNNSDTETEDVEIRNEWIGTSSFLIQDNIALQVNGELDMLINYQKALLHDLALDPYSPSFYIDLAGLYANLGFSDIAVAHGHRALLLVQAGLGIGAGEIFPSLVGEKVRETMARSLRTTLALIIHDELQQLLLKAYMEILISLAPCASFWDGCMVAWAALKPFPGNKEILEWKDIHKSAFEERYNCLKSLDSKGVDIAELSTYGHIYQKSYPWLEEKLNYRSPALVRSVNKLAGEKCWEVRPVVFGRPPLGTTHMAKAKLDVGPLGVFASRDIKAGEIIMADSSITGISNISSVKLVHCDACHCSIIAPFLRPLEIVKPTCCKAVAFCSQKCHDVATEGYHSVLCGKDFEWLYKYCNAGKQKRHGTPGSRWRPILFLRLMAVVLADLRSSKKKTHLLQHPLLARLTANYASPQKLHPDHTNDWQYFENVVAPTQILMMLGIDIFTDVNFSPEVIQTIYWRFENNANTSTTNLGWDSSSSSTQIFQKATRKSAVLNINLNPNYVFFNHSCKPNVHWNGAVPDATVSLAWLEGMNGEMIRPGASTVVCRAERDIKKDEELKITYVGGDMERRERRESLGKWFENGCGCALCEQENQEFEEMDCNAQKPEKA
ncbi:hypothetical protein B7494_g4477 [Chlorociboria aeruginascens]|nr:hypothetical protein B7494_g4477 [Chlorociboria aeruginascens]